MIEASISRAFESLEISLISVAESIDSSSTSNSYDLKRLHEKVARILSFAPHIRQIIIVKDRAVILDSSGSVQSSIDFKRLKFAKNADALSSLSIAEMLNQRFLPRLGETVKSTARRILPVELNYEMRYNTGKFRILAVFNPSYLTDYIAELELQGVQQISISNLHGDTLLDFNANPTQQKSNTALIDSVLESGANQLSGTDYKHYLPQSFYTITLSAKYPIAVSICFTYRQILQSWININAGFLGSMLALIIFLMAAVYILLKQHQRGLYMRQQIQLLSSTVEQSPVATIITDDEKAINYLNPSFNNMFNNDKYKPDIPFKLPDSQSEYNQVLALIEEHSDQKAWSGQFQLGSIVANKRVFDTTFFKVNNSITGRQHNIAMFFDVTARSISQDRIKLLSRVVQFSPVLVLVIDAKGKIEYVNQMFEAASGYTSEQVVGETPLFLKPLDTDISEYLHILQCIKSGKNWSGELQGRNASGVICWLKVRICPLLDSGNNISHYIAVGEVIDLQKENEKQRRLTDAVFRTSSEAIMVTDKNNYIQLVNKSFERITGYNWKDCLHQKPTMLKSGCHDEHFYQDFYQQLAKTGHFEGEIWNKRKSGKLYPQWINISTMRDAQ
ncbi:MAG: PAS domain S-box protein, partial [Oceanospirillaceae bacterium]